MADPFPAATAQLLALALALLYALFLLWYGGRGRPLSTAEREALLAELAQRAAGDDAAEQVAAVRALVAEDDGREFMMHNLVRWRERAAYDSAGPYGHLNGSDARAADRRYGRLIGPELLKRGCVPVFIAPRAGRFMEHAAEPVWDYVALVRYRSKRDFLRFALAIERSGIVQHKWAAIAQTRIFPVRPLLSLVMVRLTLAAVLFALWLVLATAARLGGWA